MYFLTLAEAKKHLNIENFTEDDTYIETLIEVSFYALKNRCNNWYWVDLSGTTLDTQFCDYAITGTTIPLVIKQCTLLLVGNLYSSREPVSFASGVQIPYTLEFLLGPYINYERPTTTTTTTPAPTTTTTTTPAPTTTTTTTPAPTTTTTTTPAPTTTTTTTIINKKILIDLGPNVDTYYTPSDSGVSWNNLSGGINTDVLSGLTVNNLSYSDFSISYYYIKTLTIFKSKSNAIIETDHLYPYTAYRDSFNAIISGETESCAGEIEIGNLNSDYTYTIKCYGCREYVNNNTIYTINEISIELLTKSNYDNTADFIDIQPDINNKIIIKYESDIEYSDKIAYLNVLEIIENKNVI